MNVWDEAGILPTAIRLRRAGKCPLDIDNVYGEIMAGIVHMAALLLPQEDPRYTCHLDSFLSAEVQSAMLCQCLHAAEKYIDTRQGGRSIVNYLVKTTQNRLRNWVRDTEKRREKVEFVTESELGGDMFDRAGLVMSLDGTARPQERNCKVNTREFET
jgi:hypothetical protein